MKRQIVAVGIISLMLLAGIGMTNAAVPPPEPDYVTQADLLAGQNLDVGNVTVSNDGDMLYVEYNLTESDWYLVETHLHVAGSMTDVPQTEAKGKGKNKGGNPIPGQFNYTNESHNLDKVYTYEINYTDLGFEPGDGVVIAAHAVVGHVIWDECIDVVSDGTAYWFNETEAEPTWYQAVPCWVHPSWPSIAGATWIWRTETTNAAWEYNNVPEYDADKWGWWFVKPFSLPETAFDIHGMINITADNSYELSMGPWMAFDYIGGDGTMHRDGPSGNQEWATIETYYLTDELVPGDNYISIRALNYLETDNPAGLIFNATICYDYFDMYETAWANGSDFPGNNWATYFEYEIVPPILVGGFDSVRSRAPLGEIGVADYMAGELLDPTNFGCGGIVSRPIEFIPFVETIETESLVDGDGNLLCDVFFAPLTTTALTTDEANELKAFLEAGGILYLSGNSNPAEGASYTPLFTALGWADVYTGGWSGNNGDVSSTPVSTPITTGPFGAIGPITHTPFDPISTSTATIVATGVNASNCLIAEASVGSNGGYLSMTGDPLYFDMFVDPGGTYYDADNLNYFLNLFALAE